MKSEEEMKEIAFKFFLEHHEEEKRLLDKSLDEKTPDFARESYETLSLHVNHEILGAYNLLKELGIEFNAKDIVKFNNEILKITNPWEMKHVGKFVDWQELVKESNEYANKLSQTEIGVDEYV